MRIRVLTVAALAVGIGLGGPAGSAAGDDAAPGGVRAATGSVSILQAKWPYPRIEVTADFGDWTFAKSDPCPATTLAGCSVRVYSSSMCDRGARTVTNPSAGLITGSVGKQRLRLDPPTGATGGYQLAGAIDLLQGGETVRFEAAGDATGVPAFSGQVVAPALVALTTPTSPQLVRGSAFPVAWSPSSPNGVVRVGLTSFSGPTQTTVMCEFDGRRGSGAVPAEVVNRLSVGRLVFAVDVISSAVVVAGAFTVTIEVQNSLVSGTGSLR
jgi:hypothetical protein